MLSSVSLASGAQMRQKQQEQQATGARRPQTANICEQLDAPVAPNVQQVAPSRPAQKVETERSSEEANQLTPVARDPQIQTPKPQINQLKRLLRHTNSLNQLPEYGVETQHETQLAELMDQIDVWGLNIFEVHQFSQQHSLTTVMYKIFKVRCRFQLESSLPHHTKTDLII